MVRASGACREARYQWVAARPPVLRAVGMSCSSGQRVRRGACGLRRRGARVLSGSLWVMWRMPCHRRLGCSQSSVVVVFRLVAPERGCGSCIVGVSRRGHRAAASSRSAGGARSGWCGWTVVPVGWWRAAARLGLLTADRSRSSRAMGWYRSSERAVVARGGLDRFVGSASIGNRSRGLRPRSRALSRPARRSRRTVTGRSCGKRRAGTGIGV
jgi:hypothetical protein